MKKVIAISVVVLLLLVALNLCSNDTVYAQASSNPIKGTPVTATIDYTALTGSYVTILTNTKKLVGCILTNATNAAVSWDDGTISISENQSSLSKEFYDFASNGRYINTDIRIKYTTSAPTVGNIYINCYY